MGNNGTTDRGRNDDRGGNGGARTDSTGRTDNIGNIGNICNCKKRKTLVTCLIASTSCAALLLVAVIGLALALANYDEFEDIAEECNLDEIVDFVEDHSDCLGGNIHDNASPTSPVNTDAFEHIWQKQYNALIDGYALRFVAKQLDDTVGIDNYLYDVDFGDAQEAIDFYGYYLYDIDSNGTPELFIDLGSCEANRQVQVFTVEGDKPVLLGTLNYFHTTPCGLNGRGIIFQMCQMGYEEITLVTLHNGKLESKTVLSGESPNGYIELESIPTFTPADKSGLNWTGNPKEKNEEVLREKNVISGR